jgi:Protein of unknown function (DUF4058)
MPVHDWTRVVAGNFHDFHVAWTGAIRTLLNEKLVPPQFYALAEARSQSVEPDVLTLERVDEDIPPFSRERGGVATLPTSVVKTQSASPRSRFQDTLDPSWYGEKTSRIAIHHANGDRVVAFLEIVSHGNKDRARSVESFNDKLEDALKHGCHLLVIDLHPPGSTDPLGMHATFWSRFKNETHGVSDEEPLGIASYQAKLVAGDIVPTVYFERLAVGQNLPMMPLFLSTDEYINLPLQETYDEAWRGVPARWKSVLEAPKTS